jgi:hypothetical protein
MDVEGRLMTLELSKVTQQIEDVGRVLAAGAAHRRQVLPALRELRTAFAGEQARLSALAGSPAGRKADRASPTREPLDTRYPAPDPPARATLLAADGSQINPDPHGLALYYLVNIGSLVYRYGSGQAPLAVSEPRVAYAADERGMPLATERISARRDVAELQKLADLAEAEAPEGPLVALMDSTLGLRAWAAAIPPAEQEALQASYLAHLDRLRLAGAGLAGFVSRSRQGGAVRLLDLARLEDPANPPPEPSPFLGITDQMLWGDLLPGERSALLFQPGALAVYFFYLNTDPPDRSPLPGVEAEPARIEVPEWVALSSERLAQVHALAYDQCRINAGYPYALTRADELAIILNEEREALEMMLLQAMSEQGMSLPRISPKAAQKRVARAPSRRRL